MCIRDSRDLDGKRGETFLESLKVLIAEHRSWCENNHLLSVPYGLEGCAHGNFRLAVAHIAAHQAVHRNGTLHISLDIGDGGKLIRSLVVREGFFKFLLPLTVRREGIALGKFSLCVQLEK